MFLVYKIPVRCTVLVVYRLTEKEKKRLEYKEKVLALAKDHKSAGDIEKVDRYVIPDADKVSKCTVLFHFTAYIATFLSAGLGNDFNLWI